MTFTSPARASVPAEPTAAAAARIGRFVASDDRRSVRFVVDHLYSARNLRERLLWAVHRRTHGRWLARAPAVGPSAIDLALLSDILRAVLPDEPAASWVYEEDYPWSRRGRALLFVFTDAAPQPVAVIKCAGMGTGLGYERDVLAALRARLPRALASTVPEPVAYRAASRHELLALSWLPGRSAYAELQTTLHPRAAVGRHLQAAVAWLARFHDATVGDAPFAPDAPPGSGAQDERWLTEVRRRLARRPLMLVTAHGDFWARNLLIARARGQAEASGIVDWEHCREAVPPLHDLFHFAASYGLNYPWRRFHRSPPDAALRMTFLERTHLSAEVRRSFIRYCVLRGIDFALVDPLFRLYALERAHTDPQVGDVWCRFHETLARTGGSVFSG